jgi:hypothetical protein
MTTTNAGGKGSFIVHADTVNGPGPGPVWIEPEADSRDTGIDPSLFLGTFPYLHSQTGFIPRGLPLLPNNVTGIM